MWRPPPVDPTWRHGGNLNILHLDLESPVFLHRNIPLHFCHILYDLGLKPSTIRGKLSAIPFHHKIKQLRSPSDTYLIKHLLKGFDKIFPPKKVRLHIQEKLLVRLLDAIPCIKGKHEVFRPKMLFLLCTLLPYVLAKLGNR